MTKIIPLALFITITTLSCGGGSAQPTTSSISPPATTPAGTTSVKLNWTPPTKNTDASELQDLSGYNIYYGLSSTNLNQTRAVLDPTASTATITGLSTDTVYYFSVKAFNSKNIESNSSVVLSVKTS